MAEVTEQAGGGQDNLPQFLWSAPNQQVDPPIETRQALLPIDQLNWPNAERLFLRLLARCERVPFANLFGVAGQAQDGIDVYARIHSALSHEASEIQRPFVVLQSKRVETLTAGKIDAAVDLFLSGAWAGRSNRFYYATSHSLKRTQLDEAVRRAEERLGKQEIEFVPWGLERVSELLTSEPELIDDFFGREWVRVVCGDDVAHSLEHRLTAPNYATLRGELRQLYRAVFRTQDTGVANYGFNSTDAETGGFAVLDGTEMLLQQARTTPALQTEPASFGPSTATPPDAPTTRVAPRESSRQLRSLVEASSRTQDDDFARQPLDDWVAEGRLNLLVGEPGSGKSSFLRFFATDVLSDNPQSTPIARQYGRSLPVWLPFAFLSAHLKQAESNSVLSAVKAWLERQDCAAIWPLIEKALTDDRLLLIIDGLDEWTESSDAETALGQLEIFLDLRQNISALASTRPYALNVLGFTLEWRWERLAPLTTAQQRIVANKVLAKRPNRSAIDKEPTAPEASQVVIQVENLLNELESLRHIADLARVPLFLVLLASVWSGEPLPPRRFDIYQRLVDLLIVHHPKMRERSSQLPGGGLTFADAQKVWAAVAFKLRQVNASGTASRQTFRRHLVEVLSDETVLYWSESRARDAADDILTVAEQHFGLLVSHGSNSIGFIHRVLYEHLAGEYLATLELDSQEHLFEERGADPAWRDVVLSTLCAQRRPTDSRKLLDAASTSASADASKLCLTTELICDAISCGVALAPRDLESYVDGLVADIESSPWHPHRVELLRSLTAGLASRPLREILLPNFIRWMRARTSEVGDALYVIAGDNAIDDDASWARLVWGLRHEDDLVKLQAGEALAKRFGGDSTRLELLLEIAWNTGSPSTAGAVVLGAALGWPESPSTAEVIAWARKQQSIPLRVAGIRAFIDISAEPQDAIPTDGEKCWLLWMFRRERLGSTWERLARQLVPLAVDSDNATIANDCLRTLSENLTTSWDRQVAWLLACQTFKGDDRFRNWVITDLQTEHALTLYSAADIPHEWGNDPAMRDAVIDYIKRQGSNTVAEGQIHALSALAPCDEMRDALLQCLDTWRPSWIVDALMRDYPDDPVVRENLLERFERKPEEAAKFAFVAVRVLGLSAGFSFLERIARSGVSDAYLAAMALAAAWSECEEVASAAVNAEGRRSEAVTQAADVLSRHDPAELAEICLQLTSEREDHCSSEIICAWPRVDKVRLRAKRVLETAEARPAAVIKAYAELDDSDSQALLLGALSQLRYLEPALREFIATELGSHSHDTLMLSEIVLHEWTRDYDRSVSRAAIITMSHSLKRSLALEATSDRATRLREIDETLSRQIRAELTALGTALEERRQVAWVAMLITEKFELLDSAYEPRKTSEPARVRLENYYGETDVVLAALVAQHWDTLQKHCGDTLYSRFGSVFGTYGDPAAERRKVLANLAVVAGTYPKVAAVINNALASDEELRSDSRVVQWLAGPDAESLKAVLSSTLTSPRKVRPTGIDLIENTDWQLPREFVREQILSTGAAMWKSGDGNKSSHETIDLETRWLLHGAPLVLLAEMFPQDAIIIAKYRDLCEEITNQSGSNRWTWPEAIALAVNASTAKNLPTVLLRIYGSLVASDLDQFHGAFLHASARRLKRDAEALTAILDSTKPGAELPAAKDDLLEGNEKWIQYVNEDLAWWRSYFFTRLLDGCQILQASERATIRSAMTSRVPHLVVHDPVLFEERLLTVALLDLAPYNGVRAGDL